MGEVACGHNIRKVRFLQVLQFLFVVRPKKYLHLIYLWKSEVCISDSIYKWKGPLWCKEIWLCKANMKATCMSHKVSHTGNIKKRSSYKILEMCVGQTEKRFLSAGLLMHVTLKLWLLPELTSTDYDHNKDMTAVTLRVTTPAVWFSCENRQAENAGIQVSTTGCVSI